MNFLTQVMMKGFTTGFSHAGAVIIQHFTKKIRLILTWHTELYITIESTCAVNYLSSPGIILCYRYPVHSPMLYYQQTLQYRGCNYAPLFFNTSVIIIIDKCSPNTNICI